MVTKQENPVDMPLTIRDKNSPLFENPLTVDELANLLHKAPKTIRNMVGRREIPFTRIGKTTLFLPASIRDWLKRKEYR